MTSTSLTRRKQLTEKFKPDPVINGTDNRQFVKNEYTPLGKEVYVKAGDDMSDKGYQEEKYLGNYLRAKMRRDGKRFWAGDNISDYVGEQDKQRLIDEATEAFETVLDRLLIDRETDPNSHGTARRLAKMYFNEIMEGRYEPAPDATAFPNDSADRYEGMLVVRSELRSMCSHHHQPVAGVAYIGIIAANKLIGLSKYTRIAQSVSYTHLTLPTNREV